MDDCQLTTVEGSEADAHWHIAEAADDKSSYTLRSAPLDLCLTFDAAAFTLGLSDCNDSAGQRWRIMKSAPFQGRLDSNLYYIAPFQTFYSHKHILVYDRLSCAQKLDIWGYQEAFKPELSASYNWAISMPAKQGGHEVSLGLPRHDRHDKEQLVVTKSCQALHHEIVEEIAEVTMGIAAGAEHRAAALRVGRQVVVVELNQRKGHEKRDAIINCTVSSSRLAQFETVDADAWLRIVEQHSCGNGLERPAKEVTLGHFLEVVDEYLSFHPEYQLEYTNCQYFSSWAMEYLSGCPYGVENLQTMKVANAWLVVGGLVFCCEVGLYFVVDKVGKDVLFILGQATLIDVLIVFSRLRSGFMPNGFQYVLGLLMTAIQVYGALAYAGVLK